MAKFEGKKPATKLPNYIEKRWRLKREKLAKEEEEWDQIEIKELLEEPKEPKKQKTVVKKLLTHKKKPKNKKIVGKKEKQ
ncbi:hypothetical protein HDV02_000456 [Globomyces sp. JEL0801]|nr:hypothetical protein HDV02_000456 [Globomyces sp. JEL0801]